MTTTASQRIAVTAAREALAEMPDYRDNHEPLYWNGRLKAAVELLLDAFDPDVPWSPVKVAHLPDPEQVPCPRCGAAWPPKATDSDLCFNASHCAERAAARDAEAAKAGAQS